MLQFYLNTPSSRLPVPHPAQSLTPAPPAPGCTHPPNPTSLPTATLSPAASHPLLFAILPPPLPCTLTTPVIYLLGESQGNLLPTSTQEHPVGVPAGVSLLGPHPTDGTSISDPAKYLRRHRVAKLHELSPGSSHRRSLTDISPSCFHLPFCF